MSMSLTSITGSKTTRKMEYVKTICKIGQGSTCCRYLVAGSQGFGCAKLTTLKALLDSRAEEGTSVARGDNCDGFPDNVLLERLVVPGAKPPVP